MSLKQAVRVLKTASFGHNVKSNDRQITCRMSEEEVSSLEKVARWSSEWKAVTANMRVLGSFSVETDEDLGTGNVVRVNFNTSDFNNLYNRYGYDVFVGNMSYVDASLKTLIQTIMCLPDVCGKKTLVGWEESTKWVDDEDPDGYEQEQYEIGSVDCNPDEFDVDDGYTTPVLYAAKQLNEELYVTENSGGGWWTTEPQQDYKTGEYTSQSWHPEGFTNEEIAELESLVR